MAKLRVKSVRCAFFSDMYGCHAGRGHRSVARLNGATMRPAEVAQASLFANLLEDEVADLRARITSAEQRWQRRRGSRQDSELPQRLVRLQAQLDEATRLLDSLRSRADESAKAARSPAGGGVSRTRCNSVIEHQGR